MNRLRRCRLLAIVSEMVAFRIAVYGLDQKLAGVEKAPVVKSLLAV